MKSSIRSPGIKRAIERAAKAGYRVEFREFVGAAAPSLNPPQGLCDRQRKLIIVGLRNLREHGMPTCSRPMLQAILEHEIEHAEGAEHATDHPQFGLMCGGNLR